LTEAMALFVLMIAFLILFTFLSAFNRFLFKFWGV
jgi:hypothetical protein